MDEPEEREQCKMRMVSLFDATGIMARDWARAGYECECYDIINKGHMEMVGDGVIHYIEADLRVTQIPIEPEPRFVSGFPPCTDLAVSGACHFDAKYANDPEFFVKALELVKIVTDYGDKISCPWFLENPVSMISKFWRPPDYIFHPYEFGGYIPEELEHPQFPGYIAPRDAYPKKTCLWVGNGFLLPEKKPVQPEPGWNRQTLYLGGKSMKTKVIRSATPRGFARAIFEMYA